MSVPRAHVQQQMLERAVTLPAELATTDRVLQRWAVSIGTGLPSEDWRDLPARPPPLDDDTAIVVDQTILRSPERTRKLVRGWYCTDQPNHVLAARLKLTERTLICAWHVSLWYLQQRFLASKHPTLLSLLRFRD